MWKIFKYSFYDMIRNRWMFIYMGFFLILTTSLLLLSNDLTKVVVTLTNVILSLTPLIGILFGVMYYNNIKEFVELLLSQPISRKAVFSGIYIGMAVSLSISLIVGVSIPMITFGVLGSSILPTFLLLLGMAIVLSIVFSMIAFLIAIKFEDKVKGFGFAIFTWLFFALIYDGIFLFLLMLFKDYPLEKLTIGLTLFNPIGLSRILVILNLDISAMMGYSGAVLQRFFGDGIGTIVIATTLVLWIFVPTYFMFRISTKKDF